MVTPAVNEWARNLRQRVEELEHVNALFSDAIVDYVTARREWQEAQLAQLSVTQVARLETRYKRAWARLAEFVDGGDAW